MKYGILSFILASSAAFADTPIQTNDKQKAANDQPPGMAAPDNSHRDSNPAGQIAVDPSEFLSAPQYQPQPLQQNQPSPLYSLNPPVMMSSPGLHGAMRQAY